MRVADLPLPVLQHLLPSRYAQADRLLRMAQQGFAELPPDYARVAAIRDWVHDRLDYVRGVSSGVTSAVDTLVEGAGVCRDFAHVGAALCRALGIPARYASCYAWRLDPPEHHAVFEAFLDGRWWLFDATRLVPLAGLVRVGVGRDAADVPMATIHGKIGECSMEVGIEALDGEAAALAARDRPCSLDEP